MEALRKVLKKSPTQKKPQNASNSKAKHKKLSENWEENKEAVKEGVSFYVKYLGSTLVDELEEGQSYGDAVSSEAVRIIVAMAKASGKKLTKMSIRVSPEGLKVTNLVTKEIKTEMSIYRISFCTADKTHEKVFAYIARNTENETMECHAFLCGKRKIAQAVTLTVANAFRIAQEEWEDKEQKEKENLEKKALANDGVDATKTETIEKSQSVTGNLVDVAENNKIQSTEFMPKEQSLGMVKSQSEITGFEDNFTDLDNDGFESLALSRSKINTPPQHIANPFAQFSTGLKEEDMDEGVKEFMHGQTKTEDLMRSLSVDDLLNL